MDPEEMYCQFQRDGVVFIPKACSILLDDLKKVAQQLIEGKRSLAATNGESLCDAFLWLSEPACQEVLRVSNLSRLAATVLRSTKVRLLQDQMFWKSANASIPTRWHQDISHWPLSGTQICSIWLALEDTSELNGGLRYLVGSHKWGKQFRPSYFHSNPESEDLDGDIAPNFEEPQFKRFERTFALKPGDAVIHHGLTVHASYINRSSGTHRPAYITRWIGQDVRYKKRSFEMPLPIFVPLKHGEPLINDLFPEFITDLN